MITNTLILISLILWFILFLLLLANLFKAKKEMLEAKQERLEENLRLDEIIIELRRDVLDTNIQFADNAVKVDARILELRTRILDDTDTKAVSKILEADKLLLKAIQKRNDNITERLNSLENWVDKVEDQLLV